MTLDTLLEEHGVIAAWRWTRREGEKPAATETAGAIPRELAGLGALYMEMMIRGADSECMLLDERTPGGGFFPARMAVVGGTRLVVLGTPNGVAVSMDPDKRPDLWRIGRLMREIGKETK